jgi:hypothetical protein
MISFRYHVVSVVSVLFALAVGIALGAGPLQREADTTLADQVAAERETRTGLESDLAQLRAGAEFPDAFAAAVAPRLVSGTLTGRPVTLLLLPDADPALVGSVEEMVATAGGTVAGTIRLEEDLLDVGSKQLVDELAQQLMESVPDVTVPEEATGYERLGALVAYAIGTGEDGGRKVDEDGAGVLSGATTAGLLTPMGPLSRRASLVVLVSGEGNDSGEERQAANSIVTALLTAVDSRTDGVVAAGPGPSAEEGGLLAAVRGDVAAARDISTVDALERGAGRVVTVLALAEQASGGSGHYGGGEAADGPIPAGTPGD